MQTVYGLVMIDTEASYEDHVEEFNIGFFSSRALAEKTAAKYLSEVKGFKDYPVDYKIAEKSLIGAYDGTAPLDVFIIYGWNTNDEQDETDVTESGCYLSREKAEAQLDAMRAGAHREEWCIDRYRIDECHWQEGFEKV